MTTGLCPSCLIGMEPATGRDGGLLWRCADCGHEAVRRVVARLRREGDRGMTTIVSTEQTIEQRPLSWLRPNGLNPRGPVAVDEGIRELAASIQAQGILEPLLAAPDGTIIAGHRRAVAAQLAGLATVPVIVREMSGTEQLAVMVVENLQRHDLTPLQLARACKRLADAGLNPGQIGRLIGKVESWVRKLLQMLQLPDYVLTAVERGDLSGSQAAAMGRYADRPDVLARVFEGARRFGMSSTLINALDEDGENPAKRNRQPQPGASLTDEDRAMLATLGPPVITIHPEDEREATIRHLRKRAALCAGAVKLAVSGLADEIARGEHMGGAA